MTTTKHIRLNAEGDMIQPRQGDFSFEAISKQMDFINKALYGKSVFNGATELSGDSAVDFSDKADVMAEATSEERDEDNIPL